MSLWHVWGDYVHTLPQRIGDATLVKAGDEAAMRSAAESGFDFKQRLRNGFEPWAAAFESNADDEKSELDFADYPIVRGFKKA